MEKLVKNSYLTIHYWLHVQGITEYLSEYDSDMARYKRTVLIRIPLILKGVKKLLTKILYL